MRSSGKLSEAAAIPSQYRRQPAPFGFMRMPQKKVWQTHFGGLSIFLALAQAAKSRETGEDFVTRIVI